jgi:hypothetical protein
LVAALERLMLTGEPRHTSHDDGQWLQAEVDAAIARGDRTIERLAQRAAVPFLAFISQPVSSIDGAPSLSIEMPKVLTLRRPVSYRAVLFASLDGGELVRVGMFTGSRGGTIRTLLPAAASAPGLHHLRLRANITYDRAALPREVRDLPELVYAIYDPALAPASQDTRFVLDAAKQVSAQRLDPALPDVPFIRWIDGIVLWFSKTRFGVTLRRNSLGQKGIALKDGVLADDL